MNRTDTVAAVLLAIAIFLAIGVGAAEYLQHGERQKAEKLAVEEAGLKTRVEALRKRETAALAELPRVEELEKFLLPKDQGNLYAQVLLATVEAQRQSGVTIPSYGFSLAGAAGKYPRYTVSGSASGSDEQVYRFAELLEQGPFKVQITNIGYSGRIVRAGPGGATTITFSLVYTAQQP